MAQEDLSLISECNRLSRNRIFMGPPGVVNRCTAQKFLIEIDLRNYDRGDVQVQVAEDARVLNVAARHSVITPDRTLSRRFTYDYLLPADVELAKLRSYYNTQDQILTVEGPRSCANPPLEMREVFTQQI